LRRSEGCDVPAGKFAGVSGHRQHGYAQSHQWAIDPGGAASLQGSFFRRPVRVLQPAAEYDQDLLLGQKRFLFMAKAIGRASIPVAKSAEEVVRIGPRQLEWLLDGLDYTSAHQRLYYREVA
jgi:hypothetical protein